MKGVYHSFKLSITLNGSRTGKPEYMIEERDDKPDIKLDLKYNISLKCFRKPRYSRWIKVSHTHSAISTICDNTEKKSYISR